MEAPEYCRQIEAYLCRKNEGHLIRIVGPAFEQVCGWANLGVPLKVAFRGIDQYCERYYAKGPRRRPVRIEFCEADILDLFDAWRRAIGVPPSGNGTAEAEPAKKPSLAKHIERAVVRLTLLRAGGIRSAAFGEQVDRVVRELDQLAADARGARGETRLLLIEKLRALDDRLIRSARADANADLIESLGREAEAELAPFKERMRQAEWTQAHAASVERLLRDAFELPYLAYD